MSPTTKRLTLAALAIAAFAAAVPATAQTRKPDADKLAKHFAAADKDSDGKLTLQEAKAGLPRVARNFDKIDTDKKGYVTIEDIKATMASRPSR